MDTKKLSLGFTGAMALLIILVFLPWVSVSMTEVKPPAPAETETHRVLGVGMWNGWFALICALGAGGLSVVGPARILGAKTKWVMFGVACAILVWVLLGMLRAHNTYKEAQEAVDQGMEMMKGLGDLAKVTGTALPSMSASGGTGIGLWLAFLCSIGAAAAAWLIDWTQVPVLLRIPAVEAKLGGGHGFPVVSTTPVATAEATAVPVPPPVVAVAPLVTEPVTPPAPSTETPA